MNSDDIHPLDRDYSSPALSPPPTAAAINPADTDQNYHPKLRRAGLIVFAAGFVAVFLGGVMGSNFSPNSFGEWIGSMIHRLGMFAILIGASTVMVAYQWDRLIALISGRKSRSGEKGVNPYLMLVVFNIVGIVVLGLLFGVLMRTGGEVAFFVFNGFLTVSISWGVTLIIWHQGFIRAYGVGLVTGLIINTISWLSGMTAWMSRSGELTLIYHLAAIAISGLTCSGYVYVLEKIRARHLESEGGR